MSVDCWHYKFIERNKNIFFLCSLGFFKQFPTLNLQNKEMLKFWVAVGFFSSMFGFLPFLETEILVFYLSFMLGLLEESQVNAMAVML